MASDVTITVSVPRWRVLFATAMCRARLWSIDRAATFIGDGVKVVR